MTDRVSREHRSWNMSRIRGKDTEPELVVRSMLHRMGYRFRTNTGKLPGKPDLMLPACRAVILVHGCFWHRHASRDSRCPITYTPKSGRKGRGFWLRKFRDNVARDVRAERLLRRAGWGVLTVWECQLGHPASVAARLDRLLRSRAKKPRESGTVTH